MFGWVPAEIWIFIGLGISVAFIIEIIKIFLYKNRSKKYILPFSLFIISGVLLAVLESGNIFDVNEELYRNISIYADNGYVVSFIGALGTFQYLNYKELEKSGDEIKIVRFEKDFKEFIIPLIALIFIRILLIFI
ncbi:hypothetical protein [Phascolarctobacterium sp.]|uniref:hypothetical protein n=1 Tax=Phascolarctobacterium sp. TaxID=2049039 RepID=UPI003F7D3D34